MENGLRIAPLLPKQLKGSEYVCVFFQLIAYGAVNVTINMQGFLNVMFV